MTARASEAARDVARETRSALARWQDLRPFLGVSAGSLAVLIGTSVAGGMAEAAVLALVVHIAAAMSGGNGGVPIDLGVLDLGGLSVPSLITVALALAAARLVLQLVAAYVPSRIAADVQSRLRQRAFAAFSHASWPLKAQEKEGHLQSLLGGEVSRSAQSVLTLSVGLASVINFITMVAASVLLNPIAAGLVIVIAGLLFALLRPLTRRGRAAAAAYSEANLRFSQGVAQAVRMAEETQTFGVRQAECNRVAALVADLRIPYFRSQLLAKSLLPLYQGATLLLVVGGLAGLYATGTQDLASLGAVVLLLVRALAYSQSIQSVYHSFNEQAPYIERMQQRLALYEGNAMRDGDRPLHEVTSIAFDDVSFAYVPGRNVLEHVSFSLQPGETVGIVGPSGAGKSTLIQILLRLREADAGAVTVNGEFIGTYRLDDWHRRVAYLPQDSRVIAASIRDNIRFFRPWITNGAIERSARLTGVHDYIVRLPAGYDTVIGQRADAVSGGQRQRLCMARALADDPDLLVLDEPTSALDVDSERLVQESLRGRRPGVTVVVVAHRMSTLSDCDRILVIENGKVAAFGTPDAVRRTNLFFRRGAPLASDADGATA